jgi:hypothetical protein
MDVELGYYTGGAQGWISLNWGILEPQCPQVEQPFPLVHAAAQGLGGMLIFLTLFFFLEIKFCTNI